MGKADYSNRLCIDCKHFYFDGGSPHYSELTPGNSFSMGCGKNVWSLSEGDDEADLRSGMRQAETCEHFEDRER